MHRPELAHKSDKHPQEWVRSDQLLENERSSREQPLLCFESIKAIWIICNKKGFCLSLQPEVLRVRGQRTNKVITQFWFASNAREKTSAT